MCGFITTNKQDIDEEKSNRYIKNRGPDGVFSTSIGNIKVIHSLLSITGDVTRQPFISQDESIVMTYNGEIYNYKDFGSFNSDGYCILKLYETYGEEYAKYLDGEFAITIIDLKNNKLVVTSDTFSTKPIWIGFKDKYFITASYESALIENNFKNRRKLEPNSTEVFELNSFKKLKHLENKVFDLSQKKSTYNDWISAFENSIKKRAGLEREKCFVGLSSGYDSGAISCVLNYMNIPYVAYNILGAETESIVQKRKILTKNFCRVDIDQASFLAEKEFLKKECEDFQINGKSTARNDKASAGLSKICRQARREGVKIYLSGQGADEIISDYGFGGRGFYNHSQFGGYFPKDLSTIFPWRSFYGGTQLQYINKEECVAGSHGIETRYPFLDFSVVQEFLWLRQELKNYCYKAPIAFLLSKNSYPFEQNKKIGFRPNHTFKNKS